MIRSSSQDSEVSTVVGGYHIDFFVGEVWVSSWKGSFLPLEAVLSLRLADSQGCAQNISHLTGVLIGTGSPLGTPSYCLSFLGE